MHKLLLAFAFVLGGCSHFELNAPMCEQMLNEPPSSIPKECRNYNESEAQKAFDKVAEEKKVSDKDIEFTPEEEK